jgi:UDP-N-acetylglucosamine:LPS N-acetylglucosamine transferase
VVHQCGAHVGFNDLARLEQVARMLPEKTSRRYYVATHLSPLEVGWLYGQTQLVVARAGANTVLELAARGLMAIFIPIPWVTHDEQTKNALVLVEAGTASILPESELSGERLLVEIRRRMSEADQLDNQRQAAKALVDMEATDKLTQVVLQAVRH